MGQLQECIAELPDPRGGNATRHDLLEVVTMALCAVLCGAESAVDMALFGRAREGLLRRFLKLERGVPSHDTLNRLLRLFDPEAFGACFQRFLDSFGEALRAEGQVAVDGKTVRRSFDRAAGRSPLHPISARGCEQGWFCEQAKVAQGSNEITERPALLALLDLEGRLVTAEAMHCQRDTAERPARHRGKDCRWQGLTAR